MDYRTAHIRQIRASQRLKQRLSAVAAFGVVVSVSGYMLAQQPALQHSNDAPTVAAAAAHGTAAAASAAPAQAKVRRVYPYSIVPGGVSDRAELMQAIKIDKLVAAHYAAFEAGKAVALKVSKPRAVYVSYRKGGKVYWTSRKVMLAEGETVLSDGNSEIRGRCGNRISDVAQLPVAAGEPSAEVLDTAMEADDDDAVQPASFALENGSTGASPGSVTFASGAGLIQGISQPYGIPGSGSLPGLPPSLDRSNVGTPIVITPTAPVQAIQAAQPIRLTRANPGTRTSYAGGTVDTGTPPADGSTPVLGPIGDTTPTTPHTQPELPPLPGTLTPLPSAPLVPTKPGSKAGDVPEPGSLWLSSIALAALLVLRRQGRAKGGSKAG